MFWVSKILLIAIYFANLVVNAQHNTHWETDRNTIVHLFEWKFSDIAKECETFLAPNGYAGVQVSPVNEYLVSDHRAWWERYQPISYKIISRSGNESEFLDMTTRCNNVGIRIYVDVVINHMAAPGPDVTGTGGSKADPLARDFPAVPYSSNDFNPSCEINNYNNKFEVRNCQLGTLPDLNQTKEYVRDKIVEFMNNLVDLGVAGFRVDACKHMWPGDVNVIFKRIKNLSTKFGFPQNSRPFFYQEVVDLGGEAVSKYEYSDMGAVTEFYGSLELGNVFHRTEPTSNLINWGSRKKFLPSHASLIFVDNHDNQRGHGAGGDTIITYKEPKIYKMATAFLLSYPFGVSRIMSSYAFSNSDQGPPSDENQNIISPIFDENEQCSNGWVCEHRWNAMKNMIKFRNITQNAIGIKWVLLNNDFIFMCRLGKGFIAINNSPTQNLKHNIETSLPAGTYCDIISGGIANNECTGKTITVKSNGYANININVNDNEGVIAIHIGAKLN